MSQESERIWHLDFSGAPSQTLKLPGLLHFRHLMEWLQQGNNLEKQVWLPVRTKHGIVRCRTAGTLGWRSQAPSLAVPSQSTPLACGPQPPVPLSAPLGSSLAAALTTKA